MTRAKNLLLAFAALATLASCGPKGNVIRADEYSGEDFINIDIDEKAAPIVIQQPKHTNAEKSKNTHPQKSPKPTLISAGVSASKINGQWVIIQAGSYKISEDDAMPYITFADSEGRFYASNGCNVLNGDFTVKNEQTISFDNVLSTMMLCADTGYETEISDVLRDGSQVKYKIEKVNNESYMYIYSMTDKQLLKLRRHNLEIINGQWGVAEIEDEEVDADEINVFFDIPELAIHGNTGCNFFNGVIVIDPNVSSAISFAQMGVTMRSCPNHEIERSMLVGLEQTNTYELKDNNTLLLKDADGNTLIKLVRAI